jgi:hypothetical protein
MYAYTLAEKARVSASPSRELKSRDFFYRRQANCLAITQPSLGSLTLNGPSFASIPLHSLTTYQATYLVFTLPSRRDGRRGLGLALMHSCWRDA